MKLKTLPGPGGHITPMEDGMVGGVGGGGAGEGGLYWVSMASEEPLSIFRIPVFSAGS